ncbi:MAG: NADP-dependent oxidoreductase [Richelia sp. CSU_2_1]|nr:NADP-dependent oxidoreductase [Richelia sp. CSU_2_1]
MKAVRIHAYGGPEMLVCEDAPRPVPQAGEVLVQVYAAGVNPLDWKMREGWLKDFRHDPLPLIVGGDISGVVAELGTGVVGLQVGQEVYGVSGSMTGGYAEYAIAQADAIAPKPKTLNHVQAAAAPIVAMTAWQALFEVGQLQAGQSVLIHGAAGGVGSFAVQFGKMRRLQVIATASAQNVEYVRGLGADRAIDYKTTPFEQVARELDMVLDTVGGDTQVRSWNVLKSGGILVSTATPPDREIAAARGLKGAMMVVQPRSSLLTEIAGSIDAGQVKIDVQKVFPLVEARQAQELSQQGITRGKIVLQAIAA